MNTDKSNPNDAALRKILREGRPTPGLPPRFQANVWQRIERGESGANASWIEALAALVLKPRFAFATASALVLIGALLGMWEGSAHARQTAQARYIESVAMSMSR
ncbi:MAG: hypothetical protein RLY20_2817 [Verrucomicrobiota bacterium]|jgi:hypothetical protein